MYVIQKTILTHSDFLSFPDLFVPKLIQMTMELRVGGKYRLGRKIGSGSFGDIYLGK